MNNTKKNYNPASSPITDELGIGACWLHYIAAPLSNKIILNYIPKLMEYQ